MEDLGDSKRLSEFILVEKSAQRFWFKQNKKVWRAKMDIFHYNMYIQDQNLICLLNIF